ncbi:M20/M25/M40 family metallo-hydrolase [candidate division WWE3 bacterium]|nr:M20/M25/M40 family metallo-hydrolase [candidate division WWE3 bacterium]
MGGYGPVGYRPTLLSRINCKVKMINRQRLINTFLEIVQIDSPSGAEGAMVEYVTSFLHALGVRHVVDSFGNVIAYTEGSGGPLLLSAHLDTVEPGRAIAPVIEDGFIRSSGDTILGADNKVAVASLLELIRTLTEASVTDIPSLEVIFTLSEEVANLGAVNLDYSLLSAREGFTFDSGSSLGTVITDSPFYNRFDIVVNGVACHAGHPERGLNALSLVVNALSQITLGQTGLETTCNIGLIEGGVARNIVPGQITLRGEVRSFVESVLEEMCTDISSVFQKVVAENEGSVEIEIVRENSGFSFSADDPLLRYTMRILEDLELSPTPRVSTGCYDANIFQEHGICVLNLGNGSVDNHTIREKISVVDLEMLANLVYSLVMGFNRYRN